METKRCNECHTVKSIDDYTFTGNGTYRRGQCKECHDKKRDIRNAYNIAEKIKFITKVKEVSECRKCGEDRPYLFEFHHINPENKEMNISKIIRGGSNVKRLKRELSKCIILCANCHREFHYFEKEAHITLDEYLN